jgi:hypothetical protein
LVSSDGLGTRSTLAQHLGVVGAQKIVPDLDTALDRIQHHSLPLESQRLHEVYGMPSAIGKELIIHQEQPGRIHLLLLEEAIGF